MKKTLIPNLLFLVLMFGISIAATAQDPDNAKDKINNFSAVVTVQSKGISTIPNLSLGKPAVAFDFKIGRKLAFEPQFRFALDGKPWAMVFWWRYYSSAGDKFKMSFSANYSFSYKSIDSYTAEGDSQEIIRATRYLVGAVSPNYQVNKYLGIGMYLFYARGIEKFITQDTWMVSFRPAVSNIPVTHNMVARISPDIYYLKMDDKEGSFFTARFSIEKPDFPLSISGLFTQRLKSNIPSEKDFLWKVELIYTFNKKYAEVR